jgi:D-alanyl-D-alanine carboxypeptidase (penicillin-binding protein 5/6)
VDGSKVGIVPGTSYTVDKLMTAMLVVSGYDAANALAEAAGGMKRTVRLMNTKARELQAYDTVARTPSGLDAPGETTSAYDLALIARAGLHNADFRRYVATFQIYTHNQLLTSYRGTIGVKNGYTVAAHATYVGAARRHGHTLIVTLVHAQPYFWNEARALLNWGFAAEGHVQPVGMLVDPVQPSPSVLPSAAPPSGATTVVLASGHSRALPVWQVVALAVSAAAAITVTARRQRRRHSGRLSLPPL